MHSFCVNEEILKACVFVCMHIYQSTNTSDFKVAILRIMVARRWCSYLDKHGCSRYKIFSHLGIAEHKLCKIKNCH